MYPDGSSTLEIGSSPHAMTKQEIYNIVAKHLLTQNERAVDSDGIKYKCSDGRMCAIGVLIPEEKYDPDIEGMSIDYIIDELMPDLFIHDDLLRDLQDIHDQSNEMFWRSDLSELAGYHGLNDDILRTL